MSKQHLHNGPHNIDERIWWYEDAKGIEVYLADRDGGVGTRNFTIPVREIRQFLDRLDSMPNPRIKKKAKRTNGSAS